jgi:4-amino-4-deoxy-L-arabinose transferase-like glycosyltransferase
MVRAQGYRATRVTALVAALIAVKLAIVLLVIPSVGLVSDVNYNINKLPDSYPLIARTLLDGHGYRVWPETAETMIRPPVNVFLLAGIFAVFGESLVAVQVLNVLLTVAGGALIFLLLRRRMDGVVPWSAAALYVLHPGILLAETRGGVEVPITFLMVAFVFTLDTAFASRRPRDFLIAGLVLGITGLTKSTPVAIAPFLMVYAWLRGGEQRLALCRNVLILWAGVAVCLAPWVIRNYAISGEIVPSMTIKGAAAYQGLYLARKGLQGEEFYEALTRASEEQKEMAREMGLSFREGNMLPLFYTPQDEVLFDDHLYQLVQREYRAEPWLLVRNLLDNSWRFWLQGRAHGATVMNAIVTIPLLALTLAGVVVSFRRGLGFELVVLFAVIYTLAHLPLIAFAKYHVPLIPLMAMFASVALARPLEALLTRRDRCVPLPGRA